MKRFGISLLVLTAFGLFLNSCRESRPWTFLEENCQLTPDAGDCEAAIKKYYYDPEDRKCKEFVWGGCEGTVPYDELIPCQKACECED